MTDVVWTIGHGSGTFAELERRLSGLGVSTLVDVRSHPVSRWAPQFTKATLGDLAEEAGYNYRWMGATLGGRPDDPDLTTAEGTPDLEAIAASVTFQGGVDELVGVAAASRSVVLCAEVDPARCHRATIVAPAMQQRGFEVIHVLGDGSTVPHQSTLPL